MKGLLPDTENYFRGFNPSPAPSGSSLFPTCEFSNMGPLEIPWLERVLSQSVKKKQQVDGVLEASPANNTCNIVPGTTCSRFEGLSDEIVQLVLLHLPSKDVLNLFLASKHLARTRLPQAFWKSRFHGEHEFGYILGPCQRQLVVSPNYYRDWKSLYLNLKKSDMCRTTQLRLVNRNRIWKLVQPLVHVLALLDGAEPQGEQHANFWEPDLAKDNLQWQCLKGTIRDGSRWLNGGCKTIFIRKVDLGRSRVKGAAVYMIRFLDIEYVTGIKFYCEDGSTIELGYILHQDNEVFLDLTCDRNDECRGHEICGIHAGLGNRGLHALAITFNDDASRSSKWAGNSEGYELESITLEKGAARSIKAHFDVSISFLAQLPRLKTRLHRV